MNKNVKILLGVIIIIMAALTGWLLLNQFGGLKLFGPQKSLLEQIQKQEQTQGFPQEIKSFSGKVLNIEGNIITIEAQLPSQNINELQTPTQRKIIVGKNTSLNRVVSLPMGKKGGQTLYSTTLVKVNLSDIKIGDRIDVYANQDIKYQEEITPMEITLSSS
jgi:hypothetical protein